MQRFVYPALVLMVLLAGVPPAFAENGDQDKEQKDPGTFRIFWKDGINLESELIRMKLGGRLQHDWVWADVNDTLAGRVGDVLSTNGTRRSRLKVEGVMSERIEFKMEYEFSGATTALTDAYIGLRGVGPTTIRLGKQKEPFCMEQLASSSVLTFIERSLVDTFSPGRQVGLLAAGNTNNFTWAGGVFTRDTTGMAGGAHDDTFDAAARLTWLPWRTESGNVLHLGAAVNRQEVREGDSLRFSTRPEVSLIQKFADTGKFPAEGATGLGLETGTVIGSFHAAAEFVRVAADAPASGDPVFTAWSVGGGWYLTGERRGYNRATAVFDRTKVKDPLKAGGGIGAWELTARMSVIDLSDGDIAGGELLDITLGLNWYLNNSVVLKTNIVRSERSDLDDAAATLFVTRMQFDF